MRYFRCATGLLRHIPYTPASKAADYFGLRSARHLPERLLAVPEMSDAIRAGEYFERFDAGLRTPPGTRKRTLMQGVFKGVPLGVMACHIRDPMETAMSNAGRLGISRAVYIGRGSAVRKYEGFPLLFLPKEAARSPLNEEDFPRELLPRCVSRLTRNHPDPGIRGTLERQLEQLEIGYVECNAYSSMAYGNGGRLAGILLQKGFIVIDDTAYPFLEGSARSRIKAAVLLHVASGLEPDFAQSPGLSEDLHDRIGHAGTTQDGEIDDVSSSRIAEPEPETDYSSVLPNTEPSPAEASPASASDPEIFPENVYRAVLNTLISD